MNLNASAEKFSSKLKKFSKKTTGNGWFFSHYPFYWIMIHFFGISLYK